MKIMKETILEITYLAKLINKYLILKTVVVLLESIV
jgi:hypothetical protein